MSISSDIPARDSTGHTCTGQHWNLSAVCRCIANIKDECAHDYGGCWREDFTVNGRTQTYHACHDNIDLYKVQSSLLTACCLRIPPLGRYICSTCMRTETLCETYTSEDSTSMDMLRSIAVPADKLQMYFAGRS